MKQKPLKLTVTNLEKALFIIEQKVILHLYRIERADTTQREFIGKTGDYANLKIEWTGPCSYELTFLNQHINGADSIINSDQQTKVKVEIIRVQNDSCFVIAGAGPNSLHGVVYIDKR